MHMAKVNAKMDISQWNKLMQQSIIDMIMRNKMALVQH